MSYCPFLSKNISINYVPTVDTLATTTSTSEDEAGNITNTSVVTRTPFDTTDIISKFTNVVIQTGVTAGLKSIDKFGEAIVGTQILFTECIQAQCQMWDATNSNCSIPVLSSKLTTLSNNFTDVVGSSAQAATAIKKHHKQHNYDSSIKSTLVNTIKHINELHDDAMLKSMLPKTPSSNSLMMEYMANEDVDGNEKVFGVDFAFTDDESKPAMIKNLDNAIMPLGLPEISFADYKVWADDEDENATDPTANL